MESPNPLSPEAKPEYNEQTAVLKTDLMVALVRIKDQDSPGILFNIHGREEMIMVKGEIDAFITARLVQGDLKAEAQSRTLDVIMTI